MTEKTLGKIQNVYIGFGGYQDHEMGVWFQLGDENTTTFDGKGFWKDKPSENAKWTINDKKETLGEIMLYVEKLMSQAKVNKVNGLIGIPIEMTTEGNLLKEWRILTEVL